MPARTRLPLALIALALAASACASAPGTPSGPGGSPTSDRPTTTGPTSEPTTGAPVVELLDFEAPLLDGGTFRGADLAGKDVAFWFWAPW